MGEKISSSIGQWYITWITKVLFPGASNNADLCAYFIRRTSSLLNTKGVTGLIATNTIAQSDTRTVGLDWLKSNGSAIIRAVQSMVWPGSAGIVFVQIWYFKGSWDGQYVLNNSEVPSISSSLRVERKVHGKPETLEANLNKSYRGPNVRVSIFVIDEFTAEKLIEQES